MNNYNSRGNPFLVGRINTKVVCTDALIHEDVDTGRVVRMSVQRIVLETTNS